MKSRLSSKERPFHRATYFIPTKIIQKRFQRNPPFTFQTHPFQSFFERASFPNSLTLRLRIPHSILFQNCCEEKDGRTFSKCLRHRRIFISAQGSIRDSLVHFYAHQSRFFFSSYSRQRNLAQVYGSLLLIGHCPEKRRID